MLILKAVPVTTQGVRVITQVWDISPAAPANLVRDISSAAPANLVRDTIQAVSALIRGVRDRGLILALAVFRINPDPALAIPSIRSVMGLAVVFIFWVMA